MKIRLQLLAFLCASVFNVILAKSPSYIQTKDGIIIFYDPVFTGISNAIKLEIKIKILTAIVYLKTGAVSFRDRKGKKVMDENGAFPFIPIKYNEATKTIVGPPIITSISNENPATGDSVYLYGNNFFSIQNLTFTGTTITSFTASEYGTSIGFIVPALTKSGPVVIQTTSGTFTTAYNVNDVSTGAISNFEWSGVFHWDWWGGAELTSGDPNSGWPPYDAAFSGNSSLFLRLKNNVLNSGDGNESGNAVRIGGVQWLPAGNLGYPVSSWALKFEINVPNSWNGGTICIKSSNSSYMSRYEPWQISSNSTAAYSTKGWQTVTIPLSSFRRNDATLGDGKGAPIASITDLVGSTGKSDLMLYMHNYSSSPTGTGFKAAFDNFRVVKR